MLALAVIACKLFPNEKPATTAAVPLVTVDAPLSSRPAYFAVQYVSGSGPPDDYHEYDIRIGPGEQGVIRISLGQERTPSWVETYNVSGDDLDYLYRLMTERGVFSTDWQQIEDTSITGTSPPPGDYILFRVTAYTQDGVTLQHTCEPPAPLF